MHVGNGDVNFSIVDKEVEKDPVTGYVTINASGVKGSLREHFENIYGKNTEEINNMFGKPNKSNEECCPGKIKFFSANMLAIPMRTSEGNSPYELVTTEKALDHFNELCTELTGESVDLEPVEATVHIEGFPGNSNGKRLLDTTAYIMDHDNFKSIPLPVMARNCLEKDKQNLWYEEVVPHHTVMYFFASSAEEEILKNFNSVLSENSIVQFGANASIGYGVCKVGLIK